LGLGRRRRVVTAGSGTRVCSVDGCDRTLRANNRTGICSTKDSGHNHLYSRAFRRAEPPEMDEGWQEREARNARRRVMLNELKLAAGCSMCGFDLHPCALDFDHLRDKKFHISGGIYRYSLRAVFEEIDKCQILCANCHRIKTCEEREQ
jgi:hypothetical protein